MAQTPSLKKGDEVGSSGHKHPKGEKVIAIADNHGNVLSPLTIAPVNEVDIVLWPEGLKISRELRVQSVLS